MAHALRDLSPSTAITDNNHGALIKVTAAFCAALTLLALIARLQIRWPWRSLFDKDDIVAVVATALAMAQMGVVVYGVSEGFGKMSDDMTTAAINTVKKIVYASDVLFIAALWPAKLAVALLYRRLSSDPKLVKGAIVLVVACTACSLITILLVAIPTSSSSPWAYDQASADGKSGCWIAVTALSVLIEIGLVAFPIWLVKGIHMRRSTKTLIVLAAWFRLPLIPISIVRLLTLLHNISSPNFTFDYTRTEIYTQVEMTFALLNATVICLHNFLRFANSGGLDMNVGTGGVVSKMYGTGTSSADRSRGLGGEKLSSLKKRESVKLSNLGRQHTSSAMRADSISVASDSSQRKIVVRQTVDVQYGRPDSLDRREWPLQGTANNV